MAEPDNIVVEHLRAIRSEVGEMKQRVVEIDRKLDGKAEIAHVAAVERKLDGLTHVVISSFGSVVQTLDSIDQRVSRLERDRV